MKKKILALCFVICAFALSGCTKALDLSENENNIVAQYVAGIMINM